MAQITVAPVIPVGTTGVAVYPRSAWGPRLQGAPSGSATASSLTVASNGTVTATLAAGSDYVAYRSSPETFVAHTEPVASNTEPVATVAASGAAWTVPAAGGIFDLTLTAVAVTVTLPGASVGASFTLLIRQDATGSRTVTWPAGVKWPGNAAPTLTATAAGVDLVSFLCVDGSHWIGLPSGYDLR